MGQANCAKFLLFTLKIIVTLIRILKIVIPLSLIIISMYSFFKVVTSGDDGALKKAAIDSGKRILAGVLVFLVPTIVGTMFNYFEGSKETMSHLYACYKDIDNYTIPQILALDPHEYEKDDEPISGVNNPPAGANIIAKATSKTMVFQIEKVNESSEYFLSYIWVKDPYNQNYKQHAKDYGKSNELPSDILTDTGIKNKNIIATNASGFYFVGIWTPSTNEEYQRKYNYTQEGGLVITNGQVIRNWYQNVAVDRARNDTIYGIDRTGTLVTFPKINSYTEQERKNLFQSVINTGMKNTITFRPQIIKDGKIVEWVNASSGTNHLTIFCQVDHNNFMLLHATQVIARHRAAQILLDHGCKTAVNFDGGGSVTLLYKKANEDYKVVTGNTRKMSEIFYFTD